MNPSPNTDDKRRELRDKILCIVPHPNTELIDNIMHVVDQYTAQALEAAEQRAFNAGFSIGLDGSPNEDRDKLFAEYKRLAPTAPSANAVSGSKKGEQS